MRDKEIRKSKAFLKWKSRKRLLPHATKARGRITEFLEIHRENHDGTLRMFFDELHLPFAEFLLRIVSVHGFLDKFPGISV